MAKNIAELVAKAVAKVPRHLQKRYPILAGEKMTIDKAFSLDEVREFGKTTKDFNPIHTDPEFVKSKTNFDGVIVHGMLAASLQGGIGHREMPEGMIFLKGILHFKMPLYVNERAQGSLQLVEVDGRKYTFRQIVTSLDNPDKVIIESDSTGLMPKHALEETAD